MQLTQFDSSQPVFSRSDKFLKTAFDYLITIPALLLLLPLLTLIAVAIKLESPGPVLHRRRVFGCNGQVFTAYKFRTVYLDVPGQRRTTIGQFLRRTGLDELPKLLNVLNQTMSLVGPRFLSYSDLLRYGTAHRAWLVMKPGLTGLWQINGRCYPNISKRIQLDRQYIENWSLWLDCKILLSTLILANPK
ncbi:MAG: sugar transferase [Chloroflexota bacterium]